jgi:hypothetical protein
MGKDTAGNTPPANPAGRFDADHPGYETSDVNVNGVSVFLAGLFGTVIIFFFFCYGMGKVINNMWIKQDGGASKWVVERGVTLPGGKRKDLASSAEMQQRELQQMTNVYPEPRLDIDDGNQATADLHAREDLLLENYSLVDGKPGTIRIPIERAMELIARPAVGAVLGQAGQRGVCDPCADQDAVDYRLCAHRVRVADHRGPQAEDGVRQGRRRVHARRVERTEVSRN